ncbi:MAG TPA: hypothetical protein VGY31_08005, partial [Terriglobia bacterium]|nr:hypothetical protein [Terriglobia bacterium]
MTVPGVSTEMLLTRLAEFTLSGTTGILRFAQNDKRRARHPLPEGKGLGKIRDVRPLLGERVPDVGGRVRGFASSMI